MTSGITDGCLFVGLLCTFSFYSFYAFCQSPFKARILEVLLDIKQRVVHTLDVVATMAGAASDAGGASEEVGVSVDGLFEFARKLLGVVREALATNTAINR